MSRDQDAPATPATSATPEGRDYSDLGVLPGEPLRPKGPVDHLIYFCLTNKLVVVLITLAIVGWGLRVAPFDWDTGIVGRDPVAVDAIPDIGENQQIVFTRWPGRSPQDVEDQVTYPLTVAMLSVPGVKTVRSSSMFGISSVYVIFDEDVEFYWSRTRILEKLSSLGAGTLPDGVQPTLGPDATGLGQVYWYTLEGRDEAGAPTGGWDLQELRSIQDWQVRYGLLAAEGISEVASAGGFVKEYQVDVDPDAMRAWGVTLDQVYSAVQRSNLDVGARTVEVNRVEYVVRGVGFLQSLEDLAETKVANRDGVPVYIRNVATVSLGPALRRGALDKGGAEAVGGVAVVRFGENPMAALKRLHQQVDAIAPSLPAKVLVDEATAGKGSAAGGDAGSGRAVVAAWATAHGFAAYHDDGTLNAPAWLAAWQRTPAAERPAWTTLSRVTIVPFYDRSQLIGETLQTLNEALIEEILVTIIVIIVMVMHLRSSLVISATLPLAVLVCFIAMKLFRVDANIVALSGIAIAIGTIVDMGVIIVENILRHLDEADPAEDRLHVVYRASSEVGGAVLTAVLTTIIGFLPIFALIGPEGKLFRPLAFTKTFALFASVLVALTLVPSMAHLALSMRLRDGWLRRLALAVLAAGGAWLALRGHGWAGAALVALAAWQLLSPRLSEGTRANLKWPLNLGVAFCVGLVLTAHWLPLGPAAGLLANAIAVMLPIALVLGGFLGFARIYPRLLAWMLDHKALFLSLPATLVVVGIGLGFGVPRLTAPLPAAVRDSAPVRYLAATFPGLGREFMPDLNEGVYLWMPIIMAHGSIGEALDILQQQDRAIAAIPEIDSAVGKLGRAESPLDPAPVGMFETIIQYKAEYLPDPANPFANAPTYRYDRRATDLARDAAGTPVAAPDGDTYTVRGTYPRDDHGALIPDPHGRPFRQWRPALDPALNPGRDPWPGIQKPRDIWDAIAAAGRVPGSTQASIEQPISTRIKMLQTGIRGSLGIKIQGPDLPSIEAYGVALEGALRTAPPELGIDPDTVQADRIIGKPYLEIRLNRPAIARYGVSIRQVQDVIEIAAGGRPATWTVEGRERYPVRVRYARELRDSPEALGRILVPTDAGQQIPLTQLADITFVRGPQVIKSEDTFKVGYLVYGSRPGFAEVEVVEAARAHLTRLEADGTLHRPAGVTWDFVGSYQNQQRAMQTFRVVIPVTLFLIFMILYFQFRAVSTTLIVFSGILVAWSGGFLLIWLYGLPGFLDITLLGVNLRDLFGIHPVNLSVAVWVGILALFGIASDDGVVIATYLDQSFAANRPATIASIRAATIEAARRRIRPCLMTSATTILALLPVLSSTGRGSDIMVPMAIPSFGGMLIVLISVFVVPTLYCLHHERRLPSAPPEPTANT